MKKTLIGLFLIATLSTSMLTGCGAKNNGSGSSNESSQGQTSDETISQNEDLFSEMDTEDLDGNPVDSSVFADKKLTMINVWNSGCTPCVDEIPVLDMISKEYKDKGVAVMGMIYELKAGLSDQGREESNDILSKANAEYQQLIVSEKMAESNLLKDLMAFPTTFFVDADGNIVETVEGSNDYDGWVKTIEAVLEKVVNK